MKGNCEHCGAPLPINSNKCEYCGCYFEPFISKPVLLGVDFSQQRDLCYATSDMCEQIHIPNKDCSLISLKYKYLKVYGAYTQDIFGIHESVEFDSKSGSNTVKILFSLQQKFPCNIMISYRAVFMPL